jgi:release factor glutamine methyltransferase
VESALKLIPPDQPVNVIEVGTGSGCIIISVVKNNPNQKTSYSAIEIFPKTMKVAQLNARRHQVDKKIKFINNSLLIPLLNQEFSSPLIILANLPYLRPDQFETSPSIQKEPYRALVSGPDGLDLYRRLLDQVETVKAKDITLILEIDPDQATAITQSVRARWEKAQIEILPDFCGQDRIVIVKIK